ncbi:hypothetical protein G6F63_016848 [Rhizopus arrhizus]|nr:hypothetical protein G6F63_016848 [Rhizopus arrhizus]
MPQITTIATAARKVHGEPVAAAAFLAIVLNRFPAFIVVVPLRRAGAERPAGAPGWSGRRAASSGRRTRGPGLHSGAA